MASNVGKTNAAYLAWAGWQVRVPDDWRPLRISGVWERGSMIIGNEAEPLMQIKWWRPAKASFDAARWMQRRIKSLSLRPSREPAPRPKDFSEAAWVSEDLLDGTMGMLRLWYGYGRESGLVIEIVASGSSAKKVRKFILGSVIPSLAAYRAGAATRWSVFGGSFESPPGFRLADKRLLLGDLCLRFNRRDHARLTLRQVYPAQIALARRRLEKWLEVRPFREHRKFRPLDPEEKLTVEAHGRRLEGILTSGWKKLPAPLGFCSARRSVACALRDPELDRLLFAELDSPGEPDRELLLASIRGMNWAQRETEGAC